MKNIVTFFQSYLLANPLTWGLLTGVLIGLGILIYQLPPSGISQSKLAELAQNPLKGNLSSEVNLASEKMSPTLTPTPSLTPTPTLKVTPTPTQPPATSNPPTGAGFYNLNIQTDRGVFRMVYVAADLSSTKIIVDTASPSDCSNNCPALPLADYVSRNGAFAGISGSFFCPPEYPSCAGKTNSFDTLLMNKNKTYFNSDNNVYSVVPAVVFSPGSVRFISRSLEWGRDTGIDSMIANYPLYLIGSNNQFGGSSDPKITDKGTRTFIGTSPGKIYIGIVYSAGAADVPEVLQKLGIQDALGLDQGGSTALWYGGYKAGPGRNLPNAILFLKR